MNLLSLEPPLDAYLERRIQHQFKRVYAQAQTLLPTVTEEDVLQPQQFPVLRDNAAWNYEDGVLAGLRSAQMAVRAFLRAQAAEGL